MSCGPPTMIVAVVDFKDWGLQIIALCDIGLERIITHLATGSERRSGASSSSRRESALTTLPRGEVFYHDLICFAMKILSKRVMSRGCFTLLDTPRPLKSVNHSTLSRRNANTFPILDTSYWIVSTTYRWAQRKRRKLCLC